MPFLGGDLVEFFGPLSSMHAALDHVGAGHPCAATALFRDRTISEVEQAARAAVSRFPILGCRLVWQGKRPMLVACGDELPMLDERQSILSFSSEPQGATWAIRLTGEGPDVRLNAVWAHAIADGLSMLAFLQAVSAALRRVEPNVVPRSIRPCVRHQPFGRWLPRFIIDQHRRYRHIATPADAPAGASWSRVSRKDADLALERSSASRIGFAACLAAAALDSLSEQQFWRSGRALLNIPIVRHRAAATNGFGFGIGSLILPVPIDRSVSTMASAERISHRLRTIAADGWDDNFDRFLGRDPRRHLWFARVQRRRPDPMITVSWKGRHAMGDGLVPHDVACFAVSAAAHISAHVDEDGLSISLTSRQSAFERHLVLKRLAARLECFVAGPIRDLS